MWEQLQTLQQSSTTSPRTVWVLGTLRVRTGQDDGINRPKVGLSERIGDTLDSQIPIPGSQQRAWLSVIMNSFHSLIPTSIIRSCFCNSIIRSLGKYNSGYCLETWSFVLLILFVSNAKPAPFVFYSMKRKNLRNAYFVFFQSIIVIIGAAVVAIFFSSNGYFVSLM